MVIIEDLLHFIVGNPPADQTYYSSEWKKALDEQVPGWQALVKAPTHWPMLDEVKPGGKYAHYLYELFIETAGAALAKRWFDANDDEKRRAARNWLCNLHHLSPELWQDLDEPTQQSIFEMIITRLRDEHSTNVQIETTVETLLKEIKETIFSGGNANPYKITFENLLNILAFQKNNLSKTIAHSASIFKELFLFTLNPLVNRDGAYFFFYDTLLKVLDPSSELYGALQTIKENFLIKTFLNHDENRSRDKSMDVFKGCEYFNGYLYNFDDFYSMADVIAYFKASVKSGKAVTYCYFEACKSYHEQSFEYLLKALSSHTGKINFKLEKFLNENSLRTLIPNFHALLFHEKISREDLENSILRLVHHGYTFKKDDLKIIFEVFEEDTKEILFKVVDRSGYKFNRGDSVFLAELYGTIENFYDDFLKWQFRNNLKNYKVICDEKEGQLIISRSYELDFASEPRTLCFKIEDIENLDSVLINVNYPILTNVDLSNPKLKVKLFI